MRYINLRLTYLLTYLHTQSTQVVQDTGAAGISWPGHPTCPQISDSEGIGGMVFNVPLDTV